MSAHEEKISGKRRKLFKALSAAPVVVTLRPGSALANQSAYQCLDLQGAVPVKYHKTDPGCPDGATCYGYFERPYWNPSDGSGTLVPEMKVSPAMSVHMIVKTREGTYFTESHKDVSSMVSENSDGTLDLLDEDGAKCVTGIARQEGVFLILGEPIDADGSPVSGSAGTAVGYQPVGVYPEYSQHTGVNQGITGTCMASVNGAVPSTWKITRG